MSSERNGVAFFDALKKKDGSFGEYVAPTSFFGEYVSKLEQQSGGSGNSAAEESSLEQPTTPHPKSTLPRWKRRTEQQIEANKLAQKRYRERKKAKLQEASAKVNTLQQQTQDFAALQDEVRSKERENLDLEAQLLTLEAELQQIRVGLDEKTPQGRFDAAAPPSFLSCFASPSLETKTDSIGDKWAKAKHSLDQLLVENKLHPQNPQAVDKTLEKELQKRCSAAVQQCMEMLTWGGPALDDLLRTLPGGSEDLMRESTAERYVGLINELNLSVKQIDRIHEILRDVQQRLERRHI